MRTLIALFLIFITAPAWAEPQTSPTPEQRAIAVLQAQRNVAMDQLANAEMRASAAADELVKLKAELEELKKGAPK